jgi:serpin B
VEKTLATIIADFSFRLLNQVAANSAGGNMVLSPASVFLALAATCSGTRGQAQEEIARALGVRGGGSQELEAVASALLPILATTAPPEQLHFHNAGPTHRLHDERKAPVVRVDTALWAHQGLSYAASFMEVNRRVYKAKLTTVDFSDPSLPGTVNEWVRQQSGGKIQQIVDHFHPLTVLCLVNTLYFQGAWSQPFSRSLTKDGEFHRRNGRRITVPLMRETGHFAYVQHEDFQAIALPYQGHEYEMCIVLPHEASDLEKVRLRLTATTWESWMARLAFQSGTIVLPRFSIQHVVAPDLNASLVALGVESVFGPRADFSGLFADPSALGTPIFLSQVIHKTTLDVDEEGTIAAAVTAAMFELGRPLVREAPFTMIVDRPFLCSIRHRHTGTLLFLGTIEDPSAVG